MGLKRLLLIFGEAVAFRGVRYSLLADHVILKTKSIVTIIIVNCRAGIVDVVLFHCRSMRVAMTLFQVKVRERVLCVVGRCRPNA